MALTLSPAFLIWRICFPFFRQKMATESKVKEINLGLLGLWTEGSNEIQRSLQTEAEGHRWSSNSSSSSSSSSSASSAAAAASLQDAV